MNREHVSAFLWLRWRLQVNQFRKADHRRQRIVQLVRHAAGELSQGRHLFGLNQFDLHFREIEIGAV